MLKPTVTDQPNAEMAQKPNAEMAQKTWPLETQSNDGLYIVYGRRYHNTCWFLSLHHKLKQWCVNPQDLFLNILTVEIPKGNNSQDEREMRKAQKDVRNNRQPEIGAIYALLLHVLHTQQYPVDATQICIFLVGANGIRSMHYEALSPRICIECEQRLDYCLLRLRSAPETTCVVHHTCHGGKKGHVERVLYPLMYIANATAYTYSDAAIAATANAATAAVAAAAEAVADAAAANFLTIL